VVVEQLVGVAVERGFLRQHRQPGQWQRRVGQQVTDVGHPPGAVSLNASRDSSQDTAGMTEVPGLPATAGGSRAPRSGGLNMALGSSAVD
jgi:hypothetical protein